MREGRYEGKSMRKAVFVVLLSVGLQACSVYAWQARSRHSENQECDRTRPPEDQHCEPVAAYRYREYRVNMP